MRLRDTAALAPVSARLMLFGAGCLVVVVLTHVCEAYRLLPWMGWGIPHSPGHYLDLCSAVAGLTLLPVGYFLRKRSMKLRHAAALALAGWYLMVPPSGRDYPMGNVSAPLSEWSKRPTVYRDKDECEHVLDKQRRLVHAKNRQVAHKFYQQAQCVSADDPRLKGSGGTVPKLSNP